MKKMLLLLVSGLLIACMAGSALAQNAYLIDSSENKLQNPTELKVGTTSNFGIHIYNVVPSEYRTYGYGVTVAKKVGNSYVPAPSSEITATILKTNININAEYLSDTDVVAVSLSDTAPLDQDYKVTLRIGNNEYDQLVSASEVYTSIPEFPTVALPVAAVLGLVFIFGRKKEGL